MEGRVPVRSRKAVLRFRLAGAACRRSIEGSSQRPRPLDLQVHAWTANDPDQMHRLLDFGLDGLTTDRPPVLKRVLEERGVRIS